MAIYKEKKTNTWRVVYRYTDWTGKSKQSSKRGFATKREAVKWEAETLNRIQGDTGMTFASYMKIYMEDMSPRLKDSTVRNKEHIIRSKLLPYFGERKLDDITPFDIRRWQNEMMNHKDEKGKPYSQTYLRSLNNQLTCMFNHAVRYYGLRENPATKAGPMGKKKDREMLFWTREEYEQFSEQMLNKPMSYYAFEML